MHGDLTRIPVGDFTSPISALLQVGRQRHMLDDLTNHRPCIFYVERRASAVSDITKLSGSLRSLNSQERNGIEPDAVSRNEKEVYHKLIHDSWFAIRDSHLRFPAISVHDSRVIFYIYIVNHL